MKRAQLVADAVSVLCPECGEPQPNKTDGSEQWTASDFAKVMAPKRHPVSHRPKEPSARTACVSCDVEFLLFTDSKVMFQ